MICNCIIKHAITPKERKQVSKNLNQARWDGDSVGIILALAQLDPCPGVDDESI